MDRWNLIRPAGKKLSSGINWMYSVTNANPEEPPVRYCLGRSWANNEANCLDLGLVSGLAAVRTAYADLPGLSYNRELWVRTRLSGVDQIVAAAAARLMEVAAQRTGKKNPVCHGGPHRLEGLLSETIERWIEANGFVCGREIAEHANLGLEKSFLENWEKFAFAAEEWPRERWGVCPKVSSLRVEDIRNYGEPRVCGREEALHVLNVAETWARAVPTNNDRYRQTNAPLAHLLNKEEIEKGFKSEYGWRLNGFV